MEHRLEDVLDGEKSIWTKYRLQNNCHDQTKGTRGIQESDLQSWLRIQTLEPASLLPDCVTSGKLLISLCLCSRINTIVPASCVCTVLSCVCYED